jgi:hypothetical protein
VFALNTASGVIHFHSGYLEMRTGAWDTLYFKDTKRILSRLRMKSILSRLRTKICSSS